MYILYMYILLIFFLLVILFLLTKKKKETFKNQISLIYKKSLKKKSCLIGLVGLYRTFEKTSINLYHNVIKNNPKYQFTIIINTDIENEDLLKKRNDKYKKIIYPKKILEKKFKEKYGKFGNLKITYFNNNGKYKSGLFSKRILKIMDEVKEKYDMYIFIRPDVIINKPLNIDKFISNIKIFTIVPEVKKNKILKRYDHIADWDFILIGKREKILKYLKPGKLKYKKIIKKDILELGKLNGNSGLFYRNFKNNIIEFDMNESSKWVKNWWLNLINLYKYDNIILSFINPQNINSRIIRNYNNIKE
jgi:hypothetical protein